MLKLIKVTGDSLSPFFLPGDYVLTGNCPRLFGKISEGDTIVFSHDSFGLLIKEVSSVDPQLQQYNIKGSHPQSINSRKLAALITGSISSSLELLPRFRLLSVLTLMYNRVLRFRGISLLMNQYYIPAAQFSRKSISRNTQICADLVLKTDEDFKFLF